MPVLLADGRVITQGETKLVFYRAEGRLYKAVVKVTQDGQELYLVSFYRADEREMARDLRRGQLVREWR